MPEKSRRHDPKEALEVDRLLQQLGPTAVGESGAASRSYPRGTGQRAQASGARPTAPVALPSPLGVWGRVFLGVALAAGLLLWPYRMCGTALISYLFATAMVITAGIWGAHAAWRRRMVMAHIASIIVIFTGLALVAHQLLSRLGYAAVQLTWGCGV